MASTKLLQISDTIMGPFADLMFQICHFPPPDVSPLVVLDNACGPGTVALRMLSHLRAEDKARLELLCADISQEMVTSLDQRLGIEAKGCKSAKAIVADAMDTKLPASKFTHIFFSFGPFILPFPLIGLRECHRILADGGILSFTTWISNAWGDEFREALSRYPGLPQFPSNPQILQMCSQETVPTRWDDATEVQRHCQQSGFDDIVIETEKNETVWENVEVVEAMLPWTLGMVTQKFWTQEERGKWGHKADEAVVEYLKEKYGTGQVRWVWTALVVTAKKGGLPEPNLA